MPIATIISLAVTLIQSGPEWVAFVQQTVKLLEGGALTPDDLGAMWQQAVNASAAAEAKWKASAAPQA